MFEAFVTASDLYKIFELLRATWLDRSGTAIYSLFQRNYFGVHPIGLGLGLEPALFRVQSLLLRCYLDVATTGAMRTRIFSLDCIDLIKLVL